MLRLRLSSAMLAAGVFLGVAASCDVVWGGTGLLSQAQQRAIVGGQTVPGACTAGQNCNVCTKGDVNPNYYYVCTNTSATNYCAGTTPSCVYTTINVVCTSCKECALPSCDPISCTSIGDIEYAWCDPNK